MTEHTPIATNEANDIIIFNETTKEFETEYLEILHNKVSDVDYITFVAECSRVFKPYTAQPLTQLLAAVIVFMILLIIGLAATFYASIVLTARWEIPLNEVTVWLFAWPLPCIMFFIFSTWIVIDGKIADAKMDTLNDELKSLIDHSNRSLFNPNGVELEFVKRCEVRKPKIPFLLVPTAPVIKIKASYGSTTTPQEVAITVYSPSNPVVYHQELQEIL